MSDKNNMNSKRRKLLKSAAIGGSALGASQVAPEKWLKPVVNSVVLPGHAETTGLPEKYYLMDDDDFGFDVVRNFIPDMDAARKAMIAFQPDQGVMDKLASVFIPSAHAQVDSSIFMNEYFVELISGNNYRFVVLFKLSNPQNSNEFITFFANTTLVLQTAKIVPISICGESNGSSKITLLSASPEAGADVRFEDLGGEEIVSKTLPNNPDANAPVDLNCTAEF